MSDVKHFTAEELVDAERRAVSTSRPKMERATSALAEALRAAEARIRQAPADRYLAVYEIHRDELYRAEGYDSFEAWAESGSTGRDRATLYRWRQAGQGIATLMKQMDKSHVCDLPEELLTQYALMKISRMVGDDAPARETAATVLPSAEDALMSTVAVEVKPSAPQRIAALLDDGEVGEQARRQFTQRHTEAPGMTPAETIALAHRLSSITERPVTSWRWRDVPDLADALAPLVDYVEQLYALHDERCGEPLDGEPADFQPIAVPRV